MLSLIFALVKSKKSESFGIENDDLYFCPFNLYIKSIRCYCSPFYIKASFFSMIFICYIFLDDVLIAKSLLFVLLLKRYNRPTKLQAEVSVAVT